MHIVESACLREHACVDVMFQCECQRVTHLYRVSIVNDQPRRAYTRTRVHVRMLVYVAKRNIGGFIHLSFQLNETTKNRSCGQSMPGLTKTRHPGLVFFLYKLFCIRS